MLLLLLVVLMELMLTFCSFLVWNTVRQVVKLLRFLLVTASLLQLDATTTRHSVLHLGDPAFHCNKMWRICCVKFGLCAKGGRRNYWLESEKLRTPFRNTGWLEWISRGHQKMSELLSCWLRNDSKSVFGGTCQLPQGSEANSHGALIPLSFSPRRLCRLSSFLGGCGERVWKVPQSILTLSSLLLHTQI